MINKIKTLFKIRRKSTKKTMDDEQAKFVRSYAEKYGCWHNWKIRKICMKPLNRNY
jgi:hypothetical protein